MRAHEIKKGDIFPEPSGWVALEDARGYPESPVRTVAVEVKVRYRDGAIGVRRWEDPDYEVEA